jgi:1-aminocyclopropane-1-carboxylate synthase
MLNDQGFLASYFAKMTTRLSVAYEVCVKMLREMKIPFIPAYVSSVVFLASMSITANLASNCGPFIWIDLRSFLAEQTTEAERQLAWKMVNGGVWLATGEAFTSEEPGWFRITFAVPEEELKFGMARLNKVLS